MIYIVLGMHKSGTTLVAELLHKSGIQMIGEEDGDPDYESGNKYERVATSDINKDILNCRDIASFNMSLSGEMKFGEQQHKRIMEIVGNYQSHGRHWGFKDPRTCLTYELWAPFLPTHKIIAIYRNPTQVWLHYRSLRNSYAFFKVLRTWNVYNEKIIMILNQSRMDQIVLNYERLMTDNNEYERLKHFIGRESFDARRNDAFRNRNNKSVVVSVADFFLKRSGFRGFLEIFKELEMLRMKNIVEIDQSTKSVDNN